MGRHLVGKEVLVRRVNVELLEPGDPGLGIKERELSLASKVVALADLAFIVSWMLWFSRHIRLR